MITTINNHVLFPSCDWRFPPQWQRTWETEFADAVTKHESRTALRAVGRHQLTVLVTPETFESQMQFDDAIRQAKKFGLACLPFWGRGGSVHSASGDVVVCERGWDWQPGDYVHVDNAAGDYEVHQVSAADYDEGDGLWTLTLATELAEDYSWAMARPLLFGKFTCEALELYTPAVGPTQITIAELTNARSVQIGATPAVPVGIGEMVIGSTFQVG